MKGEVLRWALKGIALNRVRWGSKTILWSRNKPLNKDTEKEKTLSWGKKGEDQKESNLAVEWHVQEEIKWGGGGIRLYRASTSRLEFTLDLFTL